MEVLINNFLKYIQQAIKPILFLALVFFIVGAIRMFQEESRDKYFDETELTASALDEEGWYYSGDLCRMDEAGYIKITGRKKDIIVRGGENISSREVEDILLQHPKIHDACVVAMSDERLGERSCAYVVLKAPHHSLSLEEVVAFFSRKRVAKYKYPEHIVVIEKLPRTASGKIQKFLLRKDIMRRLTQDVCEEIE